MFNITLTIALTLSLTLPQSAAALRPMTTEGAGLEELESKLASQRQSGLEEEVPYDEAIQNRRTYPLQSIHLWNERPGFYRNFVEVGFTTESGTPGRDILIPWSHPALTTTGIRIVHRDAYFGSRRANALWYLVLKMRAGQYREVKVDVRPHPEVDLDPPEGRFWRDQAQVLSGSFKFFGEIAIQETDRGIIVHPTRGALFLEHLPGAFTLTVDQEAQLGEMMQELLDTAVQIQSSTNIGALLDLDAPEIIDHPFYEGNGVRLFRIFPRGRSDRARLAAVIHPALWSKETVEGMVGSLQEDQFSPTLPIQSADGSRVVPMRFRLMRDIHTDAIGLSILTPWEEIETFPLTVPLLLRLVSKVLEPRLEQPSFDDLNRFGKRGENGGHVRTDLMEMISRSADTSGPAFRSRYLATAALAYDPDLEGVRFLLGRLKVEPAFTIRAAILTHLFRRHDEGPEKLKFKGSPEEIQMRLKIWEVASGLLIGKQGADYERDRAPLVRLAAVQLLARMTPNRQRDLLNAEEVLRLAAKPKREDVQRVRDRASRTADILKRQALQEGGPSIHLKLGALADPEDQIESWKIRHFVGTREMTADQQLRTVSESTQQALGLREGQELLAITVPDGVMEAVARIFAHPQVSAHLVHLPAGIRTVELVQPDSEINLEEAQALTKGILDASEANQDDLALLDQAYVKPPGDEERWIPTDSDSFIVVPAVSLPRELAGQLTIDDFTLIRFAALSQADFTLSISAVRYSELEGEEVLLIYL